MSKTDEKKNPLLDDEGASPDTKTDLGKKAKPEAEKPAAAPKGENAALKAEAIAKFPKDIVAQTKYILDNSPHINFIVPQVEGEIGIEEVTINGYKLTIKRNEMVSIPIQVAKLLAEKYRINLEAGKQHRIDRAADVSEALG